MKTTATQASSERGASIKQRELVAIPCEILQYTRVYTAQPRALSQTLQCMRVCLRTCRASLGKPATALMEALCVGHLHYVVELDPHSASVCRFFSGPMSRRFLRGPRPSRRRGATVYFDYTAAASFAEILPGMSGKLPCALESRQHDPKTNVGRCEQCRWG